MHCLKIDTAKSLVNLYEKKEKNISMIVNISTRLNIKDNVISNTLQS